ncbi:alpha-amylase family glycosyl hydrolase [uncultured Psychroserpens sp.]|uniref:alpha-amylase family glycosyl hydrolase n=1 Tax=uncultured Psychroserpens sp. TaxID=255436 RepID=UPI00262734D9|nr:alpha-amylase family glycosyl hydrolase [uncultured Psychroserpens sp.]
MKKIITLLTFSFLSFGISNGQVQDIFFEIDPCTIQENINLTITVDGSTVDESLWNINDNAIYLWAWSFDSNNENIQDAPSNGQWTNSSEDNRFAYNNVDDTYTFSLVPSTFYNRSGIGRIGFLIKAKSGDGDKKTPDHVFDVGESSFSLTIDSPSQPDNVINSGQSLSFSAMNSCGNASYILTANGSIIDTQNNTTSYSFTVNNIITTTTYVLEATFNGVTRTYSASAIVSPSVTTEALDETIFREGINYDTSDPTKATLVLDAPLKDYVYVVGSFNNWQPSSAYVMKKDNNSSKFWLELTGLSPQQIETYQYWVVDETPISGSPSLVKTADPYSTLVLSPFDDPFIPETTFPNLPEYPVGQEREVTVLQTGQTEYNWVIDNFQKPKKEDLIIYEVLIRDFDANRNYQNLIDRIDYFKNLNINAIQLMPVMEFEGNESWGYNTSFHLALDKYYGTEEKFKEFIDLCHQNGIAVILDLAINHAFGRNPMVRMWMNDPDNDGWGEPSNESPYFNEFSTHSFNVGSDFNHQLPRTVTYTERVLEHWIQDFKIDGIRWDLTKGFTQNCSGGDDTCTNAYQQDRVDKLKNYADYSWSLDDSHYVIFEHLGTDPEERQWADYRINEGKGIMLWGKMTNEYSQLTKGFSQNANIERMGHISRGFSDKRLVGYAESHDEERLMYLNLQEGNSALASHDVKDLNISLSRMSALGAASVMIPGPKMIWHFSSLGMENSIFTCTNGNVNTENDPTPGDCKLDTKPQPQWVENWLSDPARRQIYDDWSRLHELKITEDVFEGDYTIDPYINDIRQRIYISDDNLPTNQLRNVVILCNFSVADLDIVPDFPYTGNWYDLMDDSGSTFLNVTSTNSPISIPAGQFRIFGNQPSTLSTETFASDTSFTIYPNPVDNSFRTNKSIETLQIYDITGKIVKSFTGEFTKNDSYNISDLKPSLYLIKIENSSGQTLTSKLIKL